MTENSYPWPDNATGDGTSYSDDLWSDMWNAVFARDRTLMGVLLGRRNELAVTGVSSPVSINTGEAVVDGKYYTNDASTTKVISTPSASNSRIDVIVLRKDFTAQTVRVTVVAGTEAGSPSKPSITQTDGVTWDMELAEVLVDDGGTIVVTDNRVFSVGSTSLLEIQRMKQAGLVDGAPLVYDSSQPRSVFFDAAQFRFAWLILIGKEGGGAIAVGDYVGMRIPTHAVVLDKITMKADQSTTSTIKLLVANWSTSTRPTTEVSDASDRPGITATLGSEKTSFTTPWDLAWLAAQELEIEIVTNDNAEQLWVLLEGSKVQP